MRKLTIEESNTVKKYQQRVEQFEEDTKNAYKLYSPHSSIYTDANCCILIEEYINDVREILSAAPDSLVIKFPEIIRLGKIPASLAHAKLRGFTDFANTANSYSLLFYEMALVLRVSTARPEGIRIISTVRHMEAALTYLQNSIVMLDEYESTASPTVGILTEASIQSALRAVTRFHPSILNDHVNKYVIEELYDICKTHALYRAKASVETLLESLTTICSWYRKTI